MRLADRQLRLYGPVTNHTITLDVPISARYHGLARMTRYPGPDLG